MEKEMITTVISLLKGQVAQAEANLVDQNATLLLEQKVREAEEGFDAAKRALASIIMRKQTEARTLHALSVRITDLEDRTRQAIAAGNEKLAQEASMLLAELEDEWNLRGVNVARADHSAARLRLAVEKAQRRITDLRQGLITAKSLEAEQGANRRLRGNLNGAAAISEGEKLLQSILERNDPVEEIEIFESLDAELSGKHVVDRLADAGFGDAMRIRPDDVLKRLTLEVQERSDAPAHPSSE